MPSLNRPNSPFEIGRNLLPRVQNRLRGREFAFGEGAGPFLPETYAMSLLIFSDKQPALLAKAVRNAILVLSKLRVSTQLFSMRQSSIGRPPGDQCGEWCYMSASGTFSHCVIPVPLKLLKRVQEFLLESCGHAWPSCLPARQLHPVCR